jgi:hypothetical protein
VAAHADPRRQPVMPICGDRGPCRSAATAAHADLRRPRPMPICGDRRPCRSEATAAHADLRRPAHSRRPPAHDHPQRRLTGYSRSMAQQNAAIRSASLVLVLLASALCVAVGVVALLWLMADKLLPWLLVHATAGM